MNKTTANDLRTINRAEGDRLVSFVEQIVEAVTLDGADLANAIDVIAGAARAYAAIMAETLAAAQR